MKKIAFILILLLFLSGCSNYKENKEKTLVSQELSTYIEDDLSSIENLEKDTIVSFNSFASDNSKTTKEFIDFLEDEIIPGYQSFYDKLSEISPINEDIANAHNYYKTSAKYQLDAFNTYLEGLKESDYDKIQQVNSFIETSKKYLNMHNNELINIARKYEIEYTLTP